MPLSRDQLKLPVLPQEEVPVAAWGDTVIVRGMVLSQKLAVDAGMTMERAPLAGESDVDARLRAGSVQLPRVLHQCVVDPSGVPLMSLAEWDIFGATHQGDAFTLFGVAMRLSGQTADDVEKN